MRQILQESVVPGRAQALGFGHAFAYTGTRDIFHEYRETTLGRDLDITGVDHDLLQRRPQGVQWPYPEGATADTPRLFTSGRFPTASGRIRFHVVETHTPAEERTAAYPLVLLTGWVKDQWHTRTRTGKVAKLNKSAPAPFLDIHPDDARALAVRDRQPVRVVSARGAFQAPARITEAIRPGSVFAPFHWGALWNPDAVANNATSDVFDPLSKEPELKFAAVRVEPLLP